MKETHLCPHWVLAQKNPSIYPNFSLFSTCVGFQKKQETSWVWGWRRIWHWEKHYLTQMTSLWQKNLICFIFWIHAMIFSIKLNGFYVFHPILFYLSISKVFSRELFNTTYVCKRRCVSFFSVMSCIKKGLRWCSVSFAKSVAIF